MNDFTLIYPNIFAMDYKCINFFRLRQDCVKRIFSIHYFNAFKGYQLNYFSSLINFLYETIYEFEFFITKHPYNYYFCNSIEIIVWQYYLLF